MPDATYAPTPAEIAGMADPRERFLATRTAEPLIKGELAAIARDVVAELHRSGMSYGEIAAHLDISRQRVAQLLDPEIIAANRAAALEARAAKLKDETAKVRREQRKVSAALSGS